jgi:hypothetical protein
MAKCNDKPLSYFSNKQYILHKSLYVYIHTAALEIFSLKPYTLVLLSMWDTAMRLRSQRPLHVQGVAGHPG